MWDYEPRVQCHLMPPLLGQGITLKIGAVTVVPWWSLKEHEHGKAIQGESAKSALGSLPIFHSQGFSPSWDFPFDYIPRFPSPN